MVRISCRPCRIWRRSAGVPLIKGKATCFLSPLPSSRRCWRAAPIHALAGAAFDGLELRKLGFPETEDVCGQAAQASDFADPEIELFGDENLVCLSGLAVGFLFWTHVACGSCTLGLAGRPEIPDSAVSSRMRVREQPHFVP